MIKYYKHRRLNRYYKISDKLMQVFNHGDWFYAGAHTGENPNHEELTLLDLLMLGVPE